jgi:ketosteroid isomerase-like protein
MKRNPYRAAFAAMTLGLLVACSGPASEEAAAPVDVKAQQEKALTEAKAADQAFSDYAQTAGMAEAFARYMDAVDGKLISPGEVATGEAAIRAGFANWPADLKMTWSPDMGHGSASGDLAVTSGRWTRTRAEAVVAQGRYVTVWRKNDAGEWKGVIDVGAPDPAPPASTVPTPGKPDLEGRPG